MKISNPFNTRSTLTALVGTVLALTAQSKATSLFSDPFTTANGSGLTAVNANIATRQTGTLANNAYALTTAFSNISISGNQLVTGSDTGHYNFANFLPYLTTTPTNFTLSFDAQYTGAINAWISPFLTTHASADLRGASEFGLLIFQSGAVVAYGGTGTAQTNTAANTALVPDWNVTNMNSYALVATAATANTGTYSVYINGVNVLSGVPYHLGTGVTPTAGHTGLFFAHRNLTNGGGTFDNVSLNIVVPEAYWDLNSTTPGACDALTPDTAASTWDAGNTYWNATSDGTGSTAAWTAGRTAVFAAGTDATGIYNVNVDGTQDIGGLKFEEGTVTLTGGTALRMTGSSAVDVASGLTATVATPLTEDAAGRQLLKAGDGTLVLSGTSTYSGSTTVIAGTLQVDGLLAAPGGVVTVATGGTLNLGAGGSIGRDVTVSGGSMEFAGTLSSAAKLTLASGTVATAPGSPTVATADFSAGAGNATASTPLAVTSTLRLPDGVNATLGSGTSFTAEGPNLADNNIARTLALSGGTLALNRPAAASITLTNPSFETDPGTANSYSYLTITGWTGGNGIEQGTSRVFVSTAPPNYNATTNFKWAFIQGGQTMSQTFNVTAAGTYTVRFAAAGRAGSFGPLNVKVQIDGADASAVFTPSTTAWTTYTSNPVVLSAGSHTLGFVFINALGGDRSSVLDAVTITGVVDSDINLPNTAFAAAANSTLHLGTSGLNHAFGTLSIANGAQLTIPIGTGAAIAFGDSSGNTWNGTLNITGTFVSGSSLKFGTTNGGLLPAHLALITVNGGGGPFTLDDNGFLISGAASGYASWAALNGGSENLDDDHDNDGVSNGIEYFLGGPNGNTTGFTALPGVTHTGGVLSITWTKGSGYDGEYGTDFWVETSATLANPWTTETEGVTVTDTANDVTYTFPAPLGTKNFARLKVTGP